MIYSDNLTNRELLMNAMPLSSLSRNQWNMVLKHLEKMEKSDKELFAALNTLCSNQSKLEIITNYKDYFFDSMDKEVSEESFQINVI